MKREEFSKVLEEMIFEQCLYVEKIRMDEEKILQREHVTEEDREEDLQAVGDVLERNQQLLSLLFGLHSGELSADLNSIDLNSFKVDPMGCFLENSQNKI